MTRRFVLVRHGNTFEEDELPRRIGIRTDLPLVGTGREQARRLGNWFAQQRWRFERIYCSPLTRTRETAQILRSALGDVPVEEPSTLLAEIDHGVDENQLESAVLERIGPNALNSWERQGAQPPGWNVDRDKRIAGWQNLFAGKESGDTLLVTSNGAARFALLADPTLNLQARNLTTLRLRTGAFGVIRASAGSLQLEAWDQRP